MKRKKKEIFYSEIGCTFFEMLYYRVTYFMHTWTRRILINEFLQDLLDFYKSLLAFVPEKISWINFFSFPCFCKLNKVSWRQKRSVAMNQTQSSEVALSRFSTLYYSAYNKCKQGCGAAGTFISYLENQRILSVHLSNKSYISLNPFSLAYVAVID